MWDFDLNWYAVALCDEFSHRIGDPYLLGQLPGGEAQILPPGLVDVHSTVTFQLPHLYAHPCSPELAVVLGEQEFCDISSYRADVISMTAP